MDGKDDVEAKLSAGSPGLPADGGSGGSPPPDRPAAAAVHLRTSSLAAQISGSGSFGKAAAAAAAAAAAPSPPSTFKGRLQLWWHSAARLWWELPTACKATLIVAGAAHQQPAFTLPSTLPLCFPVHLHTSPLCRLPASPYVTSYPPATDLQSSTSLCL